MYLAVTASDWQRSFEVEAKDVHSLLHPFCIRKYYHTSCVKMERVQNGVLYLRYRSDPTITKAEHCKAFIYKNPSLFYSRVLPGFR